MLKNISNFEEKENVVINEENSENSEKVQPKKRGRKPGLKKVINVYKIKKV